MENVIVRPIISEKSMKEAEVGRYTFVVHGKARKNDVKQAVESLFAVTVTKVFTNIVKGTKTRFTKKGRTQSDVTYKKARVQVKKGDKIDLFEEKKEKK